MTTKASTNWLITFSSIIKWIPEHLVGPLHRLDWTVCISCTVGQNHRIKEYQWLSVWNIPMKAKVSIKRLFSDVFLSCHLFYIVLGHFKKWWHFILFVMWQLLRVACTHDFVSSSKREKYKPNVATFDFQKEKKKDVRRNVFPPDRLLLYLFLLPLCFVYHLHGFPTPTTWSVLRTAEELRPTEAPVTTNTTTTQVWFPPTT